MTILVCVLCFGVFLKQESDWSKFEHAIERYCDGARSRIDQIVLQRVDTLKGSEICGQAMYEIDNSDEPDDIYSWLTNPKQYLIYRDALVIVYGRPRVKAIPFQEISHLETLALPMGERLRVRMVNGSRIMLMTKDSDTFRAKLDEALEAFHGGQRGTDYQRETTPEPLPESSQESSQDYNQETQPEPPPESRLGESSTEDDNVPY